MSTRQILHDVARVYRLYGVGCARARLVWHGYSIDDRRLEPMLSIAGELAERQAAAVRSPLVEHSA